MRLFKHHIHIPSLGLALIELTLMAALGWYSLFAIAAAHADSGLLQFVVGFATVGFVSMYAMGLYNKELIVDPFRNVLRIFISFFVTFFVLTVAFQVMNHLPIDLPSDGLSSEVRAQDLLMFVAASFVTTVVGRVAFLKLVDAQMLKRNVMVLGVGEKASKVETLMLQKENRGFVNLFFAHYGQGEPLIAHSADRIDALAPSGPSSLEALVEKRGIDEIVVAPDERRGLPMDDILACKFRGVRVTDYLTFYEREAARIDLDLVQASWLAYSDGFSTSGFSLFIKRAFDVLVSLVFLMLTLPIIALASLAVRLDSAGPIFYRQERVGLDGKTFMLLKFRSMRVDAEAAGPQWAAMKDSRITRVGEFLRRTRIDEIPQAINVLRGDMSFIGPRPERPFFVESLAKHLPLYHVRHRMKPGITGWAQINYPYGASIADAKEKMSYDLYYLKNYSIVLDVLILLQTARVVLWPKGVR
jgi:sugar transferase (PEP-CTERM system associated)